MGSLYLNKNCNVVIKFYNNLQRLL